MNFTHLLSSVQQTHDALQQQAVKAINRSLTVRNWLIGYYIVEFEQKGEDGAKYGDRLLSELSKALAIKGLSEITLRLSRIFYYTYPQIHQTVSDELKHLPIRQTLSDELPKGQTSAQSSLILVTLPQELKTQEKNGPVQFIHNELKNL